jgi:hypothetical protein
MPDQPSPRIRIGRQQAAGEGAHDQQRPDDEDGQAAEGGKDEAAGGRFGAREAAITSKPPPSVRRVQRGRPPTAAQPEAEAEHAASVRRTTGAAQRRPCQARRSAGRGVWERRAWRAACGPSLRGQARGMTSPERLGRTPARGTTAAEARSRAEAVAWPTTQRAQRRERPSQEA